MMSLMANRMTLPLFNLIAREQNGRIFYEAKFRYAGRQVMRRIGPAWLERSTGSLTHEPRTYAQPK
jgi:hypothetical protein